MPDLLHLLTNLLPAWAWTLVSALSLALALGGILALPRVVSRLPIDWFVRQPAPFAARLRASPARLVARNVLGGILMVLGALMLVLPGQGVLTLLVGVLLTDLPVRRPVIGWVARRRTLVRALQRVRAWSDAPPFTGLPGA
jgi:hypothetical protein